MPWTKLNFGKHNGLTLPQVIWRDPDWFFWAIEKDVFSNRPALAKEAKVILKRSSNIKIPTGKLVEYNFLNGKFVGFDIVPEDRPAHEGSTATLRDLVINFSVPRGVKNYDKTGYKLFIKAAKFAIFGSSEKRMTKKVCEDFFDDIKYFD